MGGLTPHKNTVMSRKLVVGNWKMNLTLTQGISLAKEVEAQLLANPAKMCR